MSIKNSRSLKKADSPVVHNPPASVAFVHNFLDEYGLDVYEFRLYAHMVRRTGGKTEGVFFASLSKTAAICKMSTRKAQQALKVLLEARLLTQVKRKGRTDEYRVTPASEWVPREELDDIRKAVAGKGNVLVESAPTEDMKDPASEVKALPASEVKALPPAEPVSAALKAFQELASDLDPAVFVAAAQIFSRKRAD